jgi:hypothetical protein
MDTTHLIGFFLRNLGIYVNLGACAIMIPILRNQSMSKDQNNTLLKLVCAVCSDESGQKH